MKLPGAFWVAILVGAGTVAAQYFQGPWVPIVVALIGVVVKAIEVYWPKDDMRSLQHETAGERAGRFLFG